MVGDLELFPEKPKSHKPIIGKPLLKLEAVSTNVLLGPYHRYTSCLGKKEGQTGC